MSELDDIRKAYPQYNDMSDRDLADALKQKYYADMPDKEYYSQLGIDISSKGLKGVGEDIVEGAKDLQHLPAALKHLASQAKPEIEGVLEMSPKRFAQNIGAGLGEMGRGLLNIPGNVVDYAKKKELVPDWVQAWRPSEYINNFDYAKGVGLEDSQAGDSLARALPELVGYGAAGEAGQAGRLLRNAKRAASFGTQAIAHNENPTAAALVSPVLELAGALSKAGIKGGKKLLSGVDLSPSGMAAKMGKGRLSPEELAANVRAAEGTNTGLGDVIGSPKLKKTLENTILPMTSYSDEVLGNIAGQVTERAEDVVNRLNRNVPVGADTNELTKSLLDASYKQSQKIKNNLYEAVSDQALSEGFELQLPKFTQSLGEDVTSLLESPMMLSDSTLRGAFNDLIGVGGRRPTIKGAKYIANTLDTEASALRNPDAQSRALKGLYERTAKALRDDVKEQIAKKGSNNLKNLFDDAEQFYGSDFVQFLDKDIYKLLGNEKDAQSIVHEIIKPGKAKDQYTRIQKVQEILPPDKQDLLGATYLNKAIDKEGVLQPTQVAKLIDSLGKRQFEALFPNDAMRDALLDFKRLKNMNTEAINRWFNPKTGARNQQVLDKILSASGAGVGATLAGIPGAVAGAFLPGMATKQIAKMLTSPAFRDKVVAKIQKANKSGGKKINLSLPKEFAAAFKDLLAEQTASNEKESKE